MEGFSVDGDQPVADGDARQLGTAFKGAVIIIAFEIRAIRRFDRGHAVGNDERSDRALIESSALDGFQTFVQCQRSQSVTTEECRFADGLYACGDLNGSQCGAIVECKAVDRLYVFSDIEGNERGATAECVRSDHLHTRAHGNVGQRGTAVECAFSDGLDAVADDNGFQRGTALEGFSVDGDQPVADGDARQIGASFKGTVIIVAFEIIAVRGFDCGYAIGNDERSDGAFVEGSALNGFQSFVQCEGGELVTAHEGTFSNRLDTGWDIDGNQRSTVLESVILNRHDCAAFINGRNDKDRICAGSNARNGISAVGIFRKSKSFGE